MMSQHASHISGNHYQLASLPGLVFTDTDYVYRHVDWHVHEHPYFTFLLRGGMQEISSSSSHECVPGTLLFHHQGDRHYNIRHVEQTRGFHIEIKPDFFARHHITYQPDGTSALLNDPVTKLLFRKLYIKQHINDPLTAFLFDETLLYFFGSGKKDTTGTDKPSWLKKVIAALHEEETATLSWNSLAALADVHPAYLSRVFPLHFNCTVSDYIRKLKIERAINQLTTDPGSSHALAYQYGFADQSHFIKWFKAAVGVTPKTYQKIIKG